MTIESIPQVTLPQDLATAVSVIKNAKGTEVKRSDITLKSKVTEQELYGALVFKELKKHNPKLRKDFKEILADKLEKIKKHDSENYVFKAVKRTLHTLREAKQLGLKTIRNIRHTATGMCQLDSDRTRISSSRLSDTAKDTPVRTLKTVIGKLETNTASTDEEFKAFIENKRKTGNLRAS